MRFRLWSIFECLWKWAWCQVRKLLDHIWFPRNHTTSKEILTGALPPSSMVELVLLLPIQVRHIATKALFPKSYVSCEILTGLDIYETAVSFGATAVLTLVLDC